MNAEFLDNDNLRMFEAALRAEAPKERCDFNRVEHALFSDIAGAEDDGALSLLKLDEIVPCEVLERIETGLAKRIEQHIEYEMPVDECIKNPRAVHNQYWRFIENKLCRDIDEVSTIPVWEQVLKADEIITLGQWESMELGLMDAVSQPLAAESWENVVMAEETATLGMLEKVEAALETRIHDAGTMPQWEQVLRADEITEQGMLCRSEHGVFKRMSDYEAANDLVNRSIRTYFRLALSRFANVPAAAATVLMCAGLIGGYFAFRGATAPISIALFQAQGARLDRFSAALPTRGEIASEKGGSLTFVTTKGYVELQNGSQLIIKKASEKNVEYVAQFADADNQLIGQGNAAFFVKHQKKGQHYSVSTHDYRVEVTGTYFMLQPDLGGHVSVAVREGSVSIVFNSGETRRLSAGQKLAYDLNTNSYTVLTDGIVVARQDVDQLPDVKDIAAYRPLSVTTIPAAPVRIDGKFVGMSPLIIMQPSGVHTVSVEKLGFQNLDTSVSVSGAGNVGLTVTLLKTPDEPAYGVHPIAVIEKSAAAGAAKSGERQSTFSTQPKNADSATQQPVYRENDFNEAEKLEQRNWQKAEEQYKLIADNPGAPRLKREAALFSIGKLEAEHAPKKGIAKDAFLNYLALYPAGNFVGESWLRLAELEFGSDQDKAVEYYLKYFEHYPRHARISELQYRVGLIYLQKKKYDEAIGMFKLALANFQNDNVIDKGKIQTSLYKALKEKDDSQNLQPAATADIEKDRH